MRTRPKPKTRKEQEKKRNSTLGPRARAHNNLLGMVSKARNATEKRRAAKNNLGLTADIHKMIMNDEKLERDKQLKNELNNPFINTFNGLKGINSPPYTERGIEISNMIAKREKYLKNMSNRHKNLKKIRQSVVERKIKPGNKEYKHPYEKHTRRRYKAPASSIETRSMRRSQEILMVPVKEPVKEPVMEVKMSTKKKRTPRKKTGPKFLNANVSL